MRALSPLGPPLFSQQRSNRDRFISAAVAFFAKAGRWPFPADVQRVLESRKDWLDAHREAKLLPEELGWLDDAGCVVISVRGIYRAEPKHAVLHGFRVALDLAVANFQREDWDSRATLSERELASREGMTPWQSSRAMTILAAESLIAPRQGKPAEIKPEIRHFRAVESVRDYVAARAEIDRRRRCRRRRRKPLKAISKVVDSKALKAVVLSTLGILLASFLLWVGGRIIPTEEKGPSHRPPSHRGSDSPGVSREPTSAVPQSQSAPRSSLRSDAARSGG